MKKNMLYPFLSLHKNGFKYLPCLFYFGLSLCKSFGQTVYTWNQTGVADWSIASNWTPVRIMPAANDILVFNNGAATTLINMPAQTIGQLLISNNTTVNIQAAATNNQLTIAGLSTGDDLQIAAGASLDLNGVNPTILFAATGATAAIDGTMNFSGAAHRINAADANAVQFNNTAVFIQDAGCSGNAFTAAGAANAVVFNAGSTFIQKAGANPFGLAQPASKVLFKTKSLFKVQQILFLSFSGRTYADLEIDFPGFNQSVTGNSLLTVDDIIITQGTLSLNLTGGINIRGNISVAAGQSLHFNPATVGNVSFKGNSQQAVTNAGTLDFNNNEAVVFNNAAGIQLNDPVTFNGLVNFLAGIVTVPDPVVCNFSATATVVNVSDASFIKGKAAKIGNTAFTFPVGDSSNLFAGYVPVEISSTNGAVTDYCIASYQRSSAAIYPITNVGIDHVSNVDHWNLERAGSAAPMNVTFYWTATSSNNGSPNYINDLQELIIAYSNGTNWVSFSGLGQTTGNTVAGSITWTSIANTSGPFSLASTTINNPLPISLVYFNGVKQNGVHYLNWELNCNGDPGAIILLERSSGGNGFKTINTITADSLHCGQPFDFTDNNPLPGINYYRLKMTCADGKITYSALIALTNKPTGFELVGLYPTVVNNNATLNVIAEQKTKMDIVITDINGRVVQKLSYSLIAGANQIMVNLSHLNTGVYQIKGYAEGAISKTIRFIKQ